MCSRVSWLRTQILCSQRLFQSFCLHCAVLRHFRPQKYATCADPRPDMHWVLVHYMCLQLSVRASAYVCVCLGVCECSMYFALTLKAICKFRGCNYVCCVVSWPVVCPYASYPLIPRQPFSSVTLMLCLCRHPLTHTLAFSFFLFSMRLYWLLLVCCGLLAVAALPALWRPHRLPSATPRAVLNARLFIVFLTTSQIHICA